MELWQEERVAVSRVLVAVNEWRGVAAPKMQIQ
jgi:hypothetical protein